MFTFLLTTQNELQHVQTLELSGNVLDIATVAGALVLSIDTIHKPGSMTDRREPSVESIDPLPAFHFQGRQLVPSVTKFKSAKNDVEDNGRLTNLLYGLENLRKRDDGREED
jgi:tRNA (guanine-N(7)-)-methyltransferase subunit TRM82